MPWPVKFLSLAASVSWHQVKASLLPTPAGFKLIDLGGPVYTGLENFRNEFAIARRTLNRPEGPLPLGAGFLGWKLEEAQSPHVALLELALENGVQAVWLAFGEDLGRWIELVRRHDEQHGKTPKTLIFVQVNSVDEALLAVQTWKVDVLVAQGIHYHSMGPIRYLLIIAPKVSKREATARLPLLLCLISFLR